jgi:transposase-like protein
MMLQRFRIAMARRERKQLSGDIEIDEILVNGIRPNGKRGQGAAKSIVIVALEIKPPKGLGRMRMRHIPDTSDYSLLPFVHDAISPGSVILTDGWHGYDKLSGLGFIHKITKLSDSGDHAHISMPNIHRISGLLTKSFLGTFQGIVLEHLQSYLEEFTFRYNARRLQSRGLVFRRLLEQAIVTEPVTEIDVAHGYDWN